MSQETDAYNITLPTKPIKRSTQSDKVRHQITKFLSSKEFDITNKKHRLFYSYLNQKNFLSQVYLTLCCGLYDSKQSLDCIKKIVEYFDREWDTITFKELFALDKDWIPYFSENAYPDGTAKENEFRKGVCKTRCKDIMIIKRLLITNKDLDTAITLYDNINLKNFLGASGFNTFTPLLTVD